MTASTPGDGELDVDEILSRLDQFYSRADMRALAAEVFKLRQQHTPAPCVMTHTPPFDFAQCETHDTTFPLGGACRFDGREPWEVYADEAQEQRGRAGRAEIQVERLMAELADTQQALAMASRFQLAAEAESASRPVPRVITTREELDALPNQARLIDKDGDPWSADRMRTWPQSLLDAWGPFTVLWCPPSPGDARTSAASVQAEDGAEHPPWLAPGWRLVAGSPTLPPSPGEGQ